MRENKAKNINATYYRNNPIKYYGNDFIIIFCIFRIKKYFMKNKAINNIYYIKAS